MPLNLHHLRTFAAVVRADGFGAAARALGVSQPAVSRAVRDLEREVGEPLIERGVRGVRPTALGRALFDHAQAVATAELGAEQVLAAARGLASGTLHIGASTTIATYLLPPIIGAFARAHPGVVLRLSSVHTRALVPLVRRYEVDVALAEAAVDDAQLAVTRWITDAMVCIAAPTHALAVRAPAAGPLPAAALDDQLLLLREPESGTRDIVLRGLSAAGVVPTRVMAVDGTEVIKQLVAEGLGVGVVSRDAAAGMIALGRLVEVPVQGLPIARPFHRLAVHGREPSGAARAFLKLLAAEAARRELGPAAAMRPPSRRVASPSRARARPARSR